MKDLRSHDGFQVFAACCALTALLLVVFWRTVHFGWLNFDDKALLVDNPHLGCWTWENFRWALTDTRFGRRWTPLLWVVALVVKGKSALGYHALVLGLAVVLTWLVFLLLLRFTGMGTAFLLASCFVANPMRLEVFGWTMGFVYLATAIWCTLAFLTDRPWLAVVFSLLGLLTYPQAAGVMLLVLFRFRRSLWGWLGFGLLVGLAVFQYSLRLKIGFIPMHYRWDAWPWAVLHYQLMLVFPWATTPVFPAGYYPLLAVGAFVISLWASLDWKSLVGCLVILAPVLVASVTESFWFGARYALFFDIAVVCCVARWLGPSPSYFVRRGLLCIIALGGLLCYNDNAMALGDLDCLDATVNQAQVVGADCLVYRVIIGRCSPSDYVEIVKRPLLFNAIYRDKTGALVPYVEGLKHAMDSAK